MNADAGSADQDRIQDNFADYTGNQGQHWNFLLPGALKDAGSCLHHGKQDDGHGGELQQITGQHQFFR